MCFKGGEIMNTINIIEGVSIVNGRLTEIDNPYKYAIATINGRTYNCINSIRLIDNGQLIAFELENNYDISGIGLDFLVEWLQSEGTRESKISYLRQELVQRTMSIDKAERLNSKGMLCEYTDEFTYDYVSIHAIDSDGNDISYISREVLALNFVECTDCGTWLHNDCDQLRQDYNGDECCEECFYDNNGYCADCGEICSIDELRYDEDDDCDYCDHCDQNNSSLGIHDYTFTPTLYEWYMSPQKKIDSRRLSDKSELVAFELETEFDHDLNMREKKNIVSKIHNMGHGRLFYCKADCSIGAGNREDGTEIVSHPMTYDAFKKMDLKKLLNLRGNLKSYDTSNCGIHVHINRASLSPLNQYKLVSFINHFKGFSFRISQRKKSRLNEWAKFNNYIADDLKASIVRRWVTNGKKITDLNRLDQYKEYTLGRKPRATNLLHSKTIEIRIFKGTLIEESFRKNIEFVKSIADWCKSSDLNNYLQFKKYWNHVEQGDYPNLVSWVKKQDWSDELLRFPLNRIEGID